jgi:FkbM family methyltransferase
MTGAWFRERQQMSDPFPPSPAAMPRLLKSLARFRSRARAAQRLGIPMPFRRWRKASLLAALRRDWPGAYVPCDDGTLAYVPRPLDFQGEHVLFNGLAAHPAALAFLSAGGVALDIGANLGEWTVPLARAVGPGGQVLAFEPQPVVAQALERTLRINHLAQVRVMRLALSDGDGTAPFLIDTGNSGHSRLGGAAAATDLLVATRRLDAMVDELAPRHVDLIKIDVEGHERRVLDGAVETLRRFRPAVIIESGHERAADREAIATLFAALDYGLVAVLCDHGALAADLAQYRSATGACAGGEPRNLLLLPER